MVFSEKQMQELESIFKKRLIEQLMVKAEMDSKRYLKLAQIIDFAPKPELILDYILHKSETLFKSEREKAIYLFSKSLQQIVYSK